MNRKFSILKNIYLKISFSLFIICISHFHIVGQTIINMEKKNGVFTMPCKVNGLQLNFIFDTGASDVSISLTEAIFMLKNGYLNEADIIGTEYYRIANGEIEEGTKIILRRVDIGNIPMYNIEASVVHSLSAPLLLGQSALNRLQRIEFNYANSTLTIYNNKNIRNYDEYKRNTLKTEKLPDKEVQSSNNRKSTNIAILRSTATSGLIHKSPHILADVLYRCDQADELIVIDNSGIYFAKVNVHGIIGFIDKKIIILR